MRRLWRGVKPPRGMPGESIIFLNFLSQFVGYEGIYIVRPSVPRGRMAPGRRASIHPNAPPGFVLGCKAGILDYAINYICYTLILYVLYCVMTCLILYALYYAITCLINSIILIMYVIT